METSEVDARLVFAKVFGFKKGDRVKFWRKGFHWNKGYWVYGDIIDSEKFSGETQYQVRIRRGGSVWRRGFKEQDLTIVKRRRPSYL